MIDTTDHSPENRKVIESYLVLMGWRPVAGLACKGITDGYMVIKYSSIVHKVGVCDFKYTRTTPVKWVDIPNKSFWAVAEYKSNNERTLAKW